MGKANPYLDCHPDCLLPHECLGKRCKLTTPHNCPVVVSRTDGCPSGCEADIPINRQTCWHFKNNIPWHNSCHGTTCKRHSKEAVHLHTFQTTKEPQRGSDGHVLVGCACDDECKIPICNFGCLHGSIESTREHTAYCQENINDSDIDECRDEDCECWCHN